MRRAGLLLICWLLTGCTTRWSIPLGQPNACLEQTGVICSLGWEGVGDGGPARQTSFGWPTGWAFGPGGLYVADTLDARIRVIDSAGNIATIAGTGEAAYPPTFGQPALSSAITAPDTVAVCPDGWILWNDLLDHNGLIYGVDPASGFLVQAAGVGYGSAVDGVGAAAATFGFCGDPNVGNAAQLVCDSGNALFIADRCNHVVRVWNRGTSPRTITGKVIAPGTVGIIAGTGSPGIGADGIPATSSALNSPTHALLLPDGSVLIADHDNSRVRRVRTDGIVVDVAGNGTYGNTGDGGPAVAAELKNPCGLGLDAGGRLFVADYNNNNIRMVNTSTSSGTTFAGTAVPPGGIVTIAGGGPDGPVLEGALATTQGINMLDVIPLIDGAGNILVEDGFNGLLRRIDPATGGMSTFAGLTSAPSPPQMLVGPFALALEADGSLLAIGQTAYVYRLGTSGLSAGVPTIVAGSGKLSFNGDGLPALQTAIFPSGLAVNPSGGFFFSDQYNARVRSVDSTGVVHTLAGDGNHTRSGDGGAASAAELPSPEALALDTAGNLFVLDGEEVRAINLGSSTHSVAGMSIGPGDIDRIAGSGVSGTSGDFGPARSALFNLGATSGLALGEGGLFIGDTHNDRIRRVDLTTGIVTPVAGTGRCCSGSPGAPPLQTIVGSPQSVAVAQGYLYWTESEGNVVRRVLLSGGDVEAVAGTGRPGYYGDGGIPAAADLAGGLGLAVAPDGTVYVSDRTQHIRRIH